MSRAKAKSGEEGDRFALFIKIHHSLIDGVSGMKLMQRAMSADRDKSLALPSFWAAGAENTARSERSGPPPTLANALAAAIENLGAQVKYLPQLAAAFGRMITRIGDAGEGMVVPFSAPRSVLNGRVREERRFATQQFPMARLRAVATAGQCTLNDVVLAICGGALRRFLLERNELPAASLTAGIPVSVRPSDDEGSGNAISFIVATLGTDIADAAQRLDAIKTSVQHAKAHVQSLPRHAMQQYTMLLMAPMIVTLLTGIGGRTRPMFNVTISNVPGPDKPLYFRGAELLATYPASIVTHGQALNITCQSYAGGMNFGFTGCHATLPGMQKLAVYAADALAELEQALAPRPAQARTAERSAAKAPGARKRSGAPRRTAAAGAPKPRTGAATSRRA